MARVAVLLGLLGAGLSCTPISKHYEIHTGQMSCEDANRYVYDAVLSMHMVITGFRLASSGHPGYVRASRSDSRGNLSGDVKIRCDAQGVHIVAHEHGLGGEKDFERGIFLSVTGRASLLVAQGKIHEPKAASTPHRGEGAGGKESPGAGQSTPGQASSYTGSRQGSKHTETSRRRQAVKAAEKPQPRGVSIELQPVRGFATVLDFEANLSAAGILPIKVAITNATRRSYEFDPADVVLRQAGSRRRAYPLTPAQAVDKLMAKYRELAGQGQASSAETEKAPPAAAGELGDVPTARRIIGERKLRAAQLGPGDRVSGFLYYSLADYDRARVLLIDVATGETDGFLIEF